MLLHVLCIFADSMGLQSRSVLNCSRVRRRCFLGRNQNRIFRVRNKLTRTIERKIDRKWTTSTARLESSAVKSHENCEIVVKQEIIFRKIVVFFLTIKCDIKAWSLPAVGASTPVVNSQKLSNLMVRRGYADDYRAAQCRVYWDQSRMSTTRSNGKF